MNTVGSFGHKVHQITNEIADMLIEKNETYGNSALDPIRVFSKEGPLAQLQVRIDDKLSRIARGREFPGEDTVNDLIGYLILYKVALAGSCETSDGKVP